MIGKPEVRTIWLSAYGWAWTLLLPGLKAIAFVDQKMEKRFRYRLIPLAWMLDDRLGNFSVLRNQNGPGPSTIPTIPTIPTLWLHCASLGEAKGLWALVQSLYESGTGVEFKILVTANTKTGLDYLNECIGSLSAVSIISNAIEARIAPFDHLWVVSQFFQGYSVTALVLYETEIWPHYISVCKT